MSDLSSNPIVLKATRALQDADLIETCPDKNDNFEYEDLAEIALCAAGLLLEEYEELGDAGVLDLDTCQGNQFFADAFLECFEQECGACDPDEVQLAFIDFFEEESDCILENFCDNDTGDIELIVVAIVVATVVGLVLLTVVMLFGVGYFKRQP